MKENIARIENAVQCTAVQCFPLEENGDSGILWILTLKLTQQQQSVIRPSVVVPIQPTPIQEPIQQEPRMGALMHEDVLEDLTVSFDM